MPNIFLYTNYREFLRDYYLEKKRENKSFSYQVMANKAGFKSKSFLALIMSGKANLSEESIIATAKAINLSGIAADYFESLVQYNQAISPQNKSTMLLKIASYKQAQIARQMHDNEYEYLSNWYHCTIRELAEMVDFNEDYKLLASMVNPCITAHEAKKSVQLLLRLGLLKKQGNRYIQADAAITTGDDVRSMAANKFHCDILELAKQSINAFSQNERNITAVVGSLSPQCYAQVQEEILQLRKKIISLMAKDSSKEKNVYHVNFQVFPTGLPKKKEPK